MPLPRPSDGVRLRRRSYTPRRTLLRDHLQDRRLRGPDVMLRSGDLCPGDAEDRAQLAEQERVHDCCRRGLADGAGDDGTRDLFRPPPGLRTRPSAPRRPPSRPRPLRTGRLADLDRPRDRPDTAVAQDPRASAPITATAAVRRGAGTTPRFPASPEATSVGPPGRTDRRGHHRRGLLAAGLGECLIRMRRPTRAGAGGAAPVGRRGHLSLTGLRARRRVTRARPGRAGPPPRRSPRGCPSGRTPRWCVRGRGPRRRRGRPRRTRRSPA